VAGYLRLRGVTQVDELASEVFLDVFTDLADFEGSEQQFRCWVLTVAHRGVIDERTKVARRWPRPIADSEAIDGRGGGVENELVADFASERVHRVCSTLPDDQREVLLLRVLGDLTADQVAGIVGKSVRVVKALQSSALASLRQGIEWEGVPL
jgi:RNA polymerase sigma factor (sigma-70 family)